MRESLQKKPFYLKKTSSGGKNSQKEKERFGDVPGKVQKGVLCGGG
jgi:hypothetical protein